MFNRLCLGVLLLAGLVLSLNGCNTNSPSGLTTIVISPSTVTVSLAPPGYQQGQNQYTAIGYYGHAGHQTTQDITSQVTWSSSGSQVATISKTGLATATGFNPQTGEGWIGNTSITASAPGFNGDIVSNTATFNVTACTACVNTDVSAVTVLPATQTVATLGVPVQFEAIGKTVNGDTVVLTGLSGIQWVSSVPSIASINANTGLALTAGAGTATITASFTNSDGSGASGSATLTVAPTGSPEPLTAMTVSPNAQTALAVGQTAQFLAIATTGSGTSVNLTNQSATVNGHVINAAVWTSSNPSVASINPATGIAQSKAAGVAVITAIASNPDGSVVSGASTYTVTVSTSTSAEPLVSIAILPAAQTSTSTGTGANVTFIAIGTLGSGGTVLLTNAIQTVNGQQINPVSWYSSNPAVASFASSASGIATPNASGATAITAVVTNPDLTQVIGTAAYTVTATSTSSEPLTAVTIYPPNPAVSAPGQSSQLLAIGTFSAAPTTQDVTNGLKNLGGVANKDITTSWSSSNTAVATVTTACPTGLTAESCTIYACPAGSTGATCTTCPALLPVVAVAAGSSCAQLNLATPIGTVTGVDKGSTEIMAIAANPDGNLVPASTSFSVLGGSAETYTALTIYPGSQSATAPAQQSQFLVLGTNGTTGLTNDVTSQVQWCSSNPTVATIESTIKGSATCSNVVGTDPGLATAVGAGNTTFTATYTDPNNGGVVIQTATYSVTIGAAQEPLISINVVPGDTIVSNKGMTQQYLAFGTFTTTPTLRDITDSVNWISLEPNLVSINSVGTAGEQAGLATAMGYEGLGVIYAEDTTSNPDGTVVLSNSVTFTCDVPGSNPPRCEQSLAPALLATLTAFNAGSNNTNWLITAPSGTQIIGGQTTCNVATGCLIHCGPGSEIAGYGNSVCTGTYAAGTNVTLTASLAGDSISPEFTSTFGGWTANCDNTINTPNTSANCTFPNTATPSGLVGDQSAGALFYGLTLQCSSVKSGTKGVAFSSGAITVTSGTAPYTFSVVNAAPAAPLPAGLTLDTTTGAVTGTPTASGSFSITATDVDGTNAGSACAITIN